MKQQGLFDTDKTHKHPRRKIVRCLHETVSPGGSRAFAYELECGHSVVRTGASPDVEAVDCKTCPMMPRRKR